MGHKSLDWLDDNTDNDAGDGLNDFESYLRRKETEWTVPASQLTPTAAPKIDSTLEIPAADVAESSQSELTSTPESVETPQELSSSAHVADASRAAEERTTKLSIHNHAVVGSYVTEESVTLRDAAGPGIDADWQKAFTESRLLAVQECTAEQVIERIHSLDRTVFLIRAQQQGLRIALEELLATKNYAQREALLELDRKLRAKTRRVVTGDKPKKTSSGAASIAKASTKGKSKGQKGADTFKGLGFDKATTEGSLRKQNLLDEATQAYVDKLFA